MKNCGKKILSVALAAAMSCSMISAFANTVSIESIKVLNNASDAGTVADKSSVSLTPEQLLQVTVKLSPDSGATLSAGDITFLSYKPAVDGAEQVLDNTTIQYVDQQTYTAGENEVVTITFRPRTTIGQSGVGTFVAKAGGTDVATAATFNYSVAEAKKDMTFAATTSTSIAPNGTVSFTLKEGEANVEGAEVKAVSGETTYPAAYADGMYTITFAAVGTYSVTATKEGYNTPTAITVNVVENTTVPDEDKPVVEENLSNALNGIAQGGLSAALPGQAAGTGANYDIAYTVSAPEGKATYNEADKTITLNDGVFAAKVTVTANIGGTINEQKVIYLVRDASTNISFGNLALISTTAGEDAFASTEKLNAASVDDVAKNAIKVEALNYALDRAVPISAIKSAIDYDMNNDVTLSEYRMLKLLFEGNENFTADKLTAQRSSWLSQQP